MKPDNELLQQYSRSHSEEAFAELVQRHVNLVYSAALRQVGGDTHLARDAAQTVFTDLARKATSLSSHENLTGWLYTSAYFAANKIVRTENRRRQREEQFMREPAQQIASQADWEQLRPALDAVMHELNSTDREAVLLRYFENRAYAEVGAKLKLNENAARMRVDRALEKLRTLLAMRGITTVAALASVLSANAVQTAPTTLAPALASASLAGASAGGLTLLQTMNALKFKIGAGALAVASAAIVFTVNRNLHATPRIQTGSATEQVAQTATTENSSPALTNDATANNHSTPLAKPIAESNQVNAKNLASPAGLQITNAVPDTNKAIVKLEIKILTLPADKLQTLRPAWPGGDSGTLTVDQFKFIGETVEHMGNYSLTQSRITTFNGHQAIVASESPVLVGGTNSASVQTIFGVTPYFSPESSLFRLEMVLGLRGPEEDPWANQSIGRTNEITLSFNQIAVLQREIPAALLPPDGSVGGAKVLLVFVTPELGKPDKEAESETPDETMAREAARSKMIQAKDGVLALVMFASENQGQIPPTLDQAAKYFKNGEGEIVGVNFDLIYSGSFSNITKPSQIILLKEKQPWRSPNGGWLKAYGFADGHSEIHKEANGDFDKFEKEHTFQPGN